MKGLQECIMSVQQEPTGCTIYFQFYSDKQPLHILSRLTAHHQEVLFCIYSNWYMSCVYVGWLLAESGCMYSILMVVKCV
jgi:hypothetical protein